MNRPLSILLLEPYFGGSHRAWALGWQTHSRHRIELLTLPSQFWKWRMQGGAVTLARMANEYLSQHTVDLIVATDMLNLATLRALLHRHDIPVVLYLHENQLTYPQNMRQQHGWRYGFVNYISALAADKLLFNSHFHLESFFATLPNMLKHFGDHNEPDTVAWLQGRAQVLPLGLSLQLFDAARPPATLSALPEQSDGDVLPPDRAREDTGLARSPIILWNHRWEEEKNPRAFFDALYRLQSDGIEFRVVIAGENVRQEPTEFLQAQQRLAERVLHFGMVARFEDYAGWLWQADYVVSASYQDFFGIAVAEAMYCECIPVLPNRLNYPSLVPRQLHDACLYPRGGLYHRLKAHLTGEYDIIDRQNVRSAVARYDWQVMVPHYDDAMEQLVADGIRQKLP